MFGESDGRLVRDLNIKFLQPAYIIRLTGKVKVWIKKSKILRG